eukprot:scaffold94142_cov54-Phaeocystis_antarctica.AAC.4
MSVTLEVSKLSGWLNAVAPCRVERRVYAGRGRGTGWGLAGGGRPRRTQVQERVRLQIGGRARGGAHVEHSLHVLDARRVEAQPLVERRRALRRGLQPPSRDGGAHAEHVAHVCDAGGLPVRNVRVEIQTFTVIVNVETTTVISSLMSVMAETFQSAMGPYVAMADVELALNAWTAVSSSALLVKMLSSRRRWRAGGKGEPARNNGSHCSGQATPSGLDGYRCDEARPVTSRSGETGTTTARCSNHCCSPDAGGCAGPVPMVAAPVPKTAAAKRMRMQFTARSVAWRDGKSSGHRMCWLRAERARGWCPRVCGARGGGWG